MSHVLWVTKHLSRLHFTAGTCWLLLSTLDRGGDGDCLLDSEFSLVTGHTFLASIGSHYLATPLKVPRTPRASQDIFTAIPTGNC